MIKTKKGYIKVDTVRNDIIHISFSRKEVIDTTSLIIVGGVCDYTDDNCLISTDINGDNSAITFTNRKTGEVFLKEKKKTLMR